MLSDVQTMEIFQKIVPINKKCHMRKIIRLLCFMLQNTLFRVTFCSIVAVGTKVNGSNTMAQLIQLRDRIRTIETIHKITHAMRLISMSHHARLKYKEEHLQ